MANLNELKPEDVMKALERCKSANAIDCDGCPYKGKHDAEDFYIRCRNFLIRDALALLRQNQSQINMLAEDRIGWADEAVKAQMKVNENDSRIAELEEYYKRYFCKEEEIKELQCEIEHLKDRLSLFDKTLAEKYAEIERLRKAKCIYSTVDYCSDDLAKAQEEIERLTQERDRAQAVCVQMGKLNQTERAKTITEFAERLKKYYGSLKGKTASGMVEYHIDQIAKEMREVQNA